jgi:hypothetical protein
MGTNLRAEFVLLGDALDHGAITSAVGLSPTATWKAGDQIRGTKLRRDRDGWVWGTPKRDGLDLEVPLRELLEALSNAAPAIRSILKRGSVEAVISCAVYVVNGAVPAVCLPHRMLAAIAELGASLDVDVILTQES